MESFELSVEIVAHDARTTGEKGKLGLDSSLSELEQIEGTRIAIASSEYVKCLRKTVSPARGVQARSLVVGDKSGSRDVGYPIPKVGLLGDRPAVSGGRQKTQRDGLQCKVESDAVEGPVVKATKVLCTPSLRKEKGQLTAGMCLFRVIDRGKSEARLPSSRDQGHLGVCPDRICMHRATRDRESSISVDRFLKDRWLLARSIEVRGNPVSMDSGREVWVDQEASIVGVKSSLMGELQRVGGSISVPEELQDSASAAIEKNVWEMQNVVRSVDAYIEWAHSTTFDLDSAILAWSAEVVGRVVGRSQSGVSEGRTACERRKRRHCRNASVQ